MREGRLVGKHLFAIKIVCKNVHGDKDDQDDKINKQNRSGGRQTQIGMNGEKNLILSPVEIMAPTIPDSGHKGKQNR